MPARAPKEFRVLPNVLFFSAVGLIGIATAVYMRTALQSNVLFLIILGALVAAFFAFFPMTADVNINKSVQFTGSAAVFCWIVWFTVPAAQELRKHDLLRENEIIEFNMSKAANLAATIEKTSEILRVIETTMNRAKGGADKAREELGRAADTGRALKSAVDRAMSAVDIAKSAQGLPATAIKDLEGLTAIAALAEKLDAEIRAAQAAFPRPLDLAAAEQSRDLDALAAPGVLAETACGGRHYYRAHWAPWLPPGAGDRS